jgi:protein-S-isoprenylcysteine O-methyltransferase Ste14
MSLAQRIARWRVTIGFVLAAVVLWLAEPTRTSLLWGGAIAALGEMMRLWAAGHVEKSREVTRSGPYRFTRHPLYLGSSLIGMGFAVASASWAVAAIVLGYLATTITAAVRAEEAHLREKFGTEYDAYAARTAPPMIRAFSLTRALDNREHHTIAGLVVALLLLAFKVGYSIR